MIFSSILMSILHISTDSLFSVNQNRFKIAQEFFFYKLFFSFHLLLSLSLRLAIFAFHYYIFLLKEHTFKKKRAPCISWWSYSNLNNYSSRWIDRFDGNISRIPKNVASLKHVERRFVRGFIFNISLLISDTRRVLGD
jgi:hypothetical protein